MASTAAALEERTTAVENGAGSVELTTGAGPAKHIHHQAYACWDSEETRHFYEDILEMPLIATVVVEDHVRARRSLRPQRVPLILHIYQVRIVQ
jgi:hypothetical protein